MFSENLGVERGIFFWINTGVWFCFWSQQANAELGAVWSVGQRIWQRDFPGIYTAISAHQWSETVQPIMEALRGTSWAPEGSRELPGITCVCSNRNKLFIVKNQDNCWQVFVGFTKRVSGVGCKLKALQNLVETTKLVSVGFCFCVFFDTGFS